MATFSINGATFTGSSITVRDNVVIVDGVKIDYDPSQNSGIVEVRVIDGVVDSVSSDCGITAQNIAGNATAGHNITAKDVRGDVKAGHGVRCETVGGSVTAGHSINCGRIGGSATAGHNIRHA